MISRLISLPKKQHFFLFGPRQTGKSTLLHHLYSPQQTVWYDLLDTDVFLRLSAHPSLFRQEILSRQSHQQYVVVDEVQRVPDLLNEIHWLIEQSHTPYFILTGSSARKLKRSQANLLAGRALTYHLFPLTQTEIGEDFSLIDALQFGTLPKIVLDQDDTIRNERLRSYVDTYMKEEIEQEIHTRRLGAFTRFLTLAAAENGNQINYSNLASDTGISYHTIKAHFQILEDTLLGTFLFPYVASVRQRLVKQPKFYFFDTGIVRALTKQLTVSLVPGTAEFGRAFEHFIFLELISYSAYYRLDYTFHYYRTAAGAEVDFIVITPVGQIFAIEVKGTHLVRNQQLRGLHSFAKIHPAAKLVCVSLDTHRRELSGVTILPWRELITWLHTTQ